MRSLIYASLLLVLACTVTSQSSVATVPGLVNYQGRVTDLSGAPLDGTQIITFSIYDVALGGSALWSETHSGVVISEGLFSVLLGSISPFPVSLFNDSLRYLGITVGADPELTPRSRITSVAYSIRSTYADSTGSDGLWTESDGNIYRSTGKVGIGTLNPTRNLDVAGSIHADAFGLGPNTPWSSNGICLDHSKSINWDDRNDCGFLMYEEGSTNTLVSTSSGCGSQDNWKWVSAGMGELFRIGSTITTTRNFGIGTASPTAKLDVVGQIKGQTSSDGVNAIEGSSSGNYSAVAGLNSGSGPGIFGETYANQSTVAGVVGKAKTDGASGIYGETQSLGIPLGSSVAVYGWAPASGQSVGGAALGVLGRVNSSQGPSASVPCGVFGWATATSGVNAGVWGESDSPDGFGIYSAGKMNVDGAIFCNNNIYAGSSASKLGVGTFSAPNIITVVQGSATDPVADAWTTYSSKRWKQNIAPLHGALDKVIQLQGVTFDWIEGGKHDIGLIAEEVGEIIPEVVAYEENGVDAQSIDYGRLVPVLIEAMKEQQKTIEKLQKMLADFQRLAKMHSTGCEDLNDVSGGH